MILVDRHRLFVGIALLPLLAAGCATFVTSKPAKQNNTGIEYTLCLPALVAKPQPDGRVKFEKTCLPDPDRRYVVSGSTFLGNLTLNIKRKSDMTVEEVTIDPNNATVAAEAIAAASAIEQKKIEVKAAAEKEKAAEEKAALDEAKKALNDAEVAQKSATAALEQVEDALKNAQRELETLQKVHGLGDRKPEDVIADSGIQLETREAVRRAYLAAKEKEAARDAAKKALHNANAALAEAEKKRSQLASSGNVFDAASGNVPPKGRNPPKQVWGPLIYRLEQTVDKGELKVRLVAMFEQPRLETIAVKSPTVPTPKVSAIVSAITKEDNGTYDITITLSGKVDSIDAAQIYLQHTDTTRVTPTKADANDEKTKIHLIVPAGQKTGEYRIVVPVVIGGNQKEVRDAKVRLN